jgi:stage V sporulation protein R
VSGVFYHTNLPPDLRLLKEEIEGYAREYGLDFFETIFEVVDADDLNEIAAYGGFPTRYPHWSFGMAYEELRKGYDYGLSKIYEMVINNDPCYAYLMRSNHTVDQKLVMAHVYGHCDFFKNNAYFAHTNRKMMDEIANHGARIRHYAERFGEDEVEAFLDRCMSIDDLIDIHSTAIKRREDVSRYDFKEREEEGPRLTRFKSKSYMDEFINPGAMLRAEEEQARKVSQQAALSFPERPEKDVLLFLIEHAPVKNWQRDILEIIRNEAYYFTPQGQTKILNEGWACAVRETHVLTDRGIMQLGELVEERQAVRVTDGEEPQPVYDWARFSDRETVWVRTRRGLELEGSLTHRVLLPSGDWKALGEVTVGDRIQLSRGTNLWAGDHVPVTWRAEDRLTLAGVAERAGVSFDTARRVQKGLTKASRHAAELAPLLAEYTADRAAKTSMQNRRKAIRVPEVVDERFGAFLGYLIGDGHISAVKRTLGLTTGDESQADHFAALLTDLFGLTTRKKWDESKWRVLVSSRQLQELLLSLGLETGFAARKKTVPDVVLRSPKPVVAAFLRALYDCDGYAGKAGVILSTASEEMSKLVQLLLLNFGVLSTRRRQRHDIWHVHTLGKSAEVFGREIGFGLERKRAALAAYVGDRKWFRKEDDSDEVVAVERRRADVFDVSVAHTHRYVAQGFINHNSYWHSTIMTQKVLEPSECIDYADHHSGTMATSRGRLNPYKLGIELLRDIEQRWNAGRFGPEWEECDDLDKKRNWNRNLGLGRQKIFEVRRIHNDLTFIDTFLTPEFCRDHNLFSFSWHDQPGQYIIESREFPKIKQRLLFSLTNSGRPWIYVVNGNHRNRGELLLKHEHAGIDLKLNYAQDTLANLQFIWSRPVHLETIVDGKPTLLSFDGTEHTQKPIGEPDDARRNPAPKPR